MSVGKTFENMSYPQLNACRSDKATVNLNWRKDAQSEYFVLFEAYPKRLANAASLYCAAQIQAHPNRKALMVTGGSMAGCKLVFESVLKYCADNAYLPKLEGFGAWMRIHEAAQLLGVGVVEGVAMVEMNILLEKPLTQNDMENILKMQPVAHRYEQMIIDNLTDAMVKGEDGWHRAHLWYQILDDRYPILKQKIEDALQQKEDVRDQATWDRYNAITAEEDRKKAEEIEKRRNYYREKEAKERVAQEKKAQQVAARGTTYATIASAPVLAVKPVSKRIVAKCDGG